MPPIVPEQARNDDKQAGQMAGDYSVLITPPAPTRCHGKPSTNVLELFAVEFDLAAVANTGPVKLALIQAPCGKPHAHAIVHQHFHPVSPAVGEQVSAVRLRRTEHRDHPS